MGWGKSTRPVINVSWYDAREYTNWLSEQTGMLYRFPNEAEWEYVARAGSDKAHWWGDKIGNNKANCARSGSEWSNKGTAPTGSFKANKFGLYDTPGNVWEWAEDYWHGNYNQAPVDGRAWLAENDLRSIPTHCLMCRTNQRHSLQMIPPEQFACCPIDYHNHHN